MCLQLYAGGGPPFLATGPYFGLVMFSCPCVGSLAVSCLLALLTVLGFPGFDDENHYFLLTVLGFPGFDNDNHLFLLTVLGFPGIIIFCLQSWVFQVL